MLRNAVSYFFAASANDMISSRSAGTRSSRNQIYIETRHWAERLAFFRQAHFGKTLDVLLMLLVNDGTSASESPVDQVHKSGAHL